MRKLVMHAGFHKTGTTSIQNFSYQNHDKLLTNGIYYPKENPSFQNHCYLTINNNISELQKMLCNFDEKNLTIFLSCEEFCPLIGETDSYLVDYFFSSLKHKYEIIDVVITTRDTKKLLRSAAREYIEGSGVPMHGMGEMLNKYVSSAKKFISHLSKNSINTIYLNIDNLPKNKNLINYFFEKVFSIELNEPNLILNSTNEKKISSIFNANFRTLFSTVNNFSHYSNEVNYFVEQVQNGINIDIEIEKLIEKNFEIYLDFQINKFFSEKIISLP